MLFRVDLTPEFTWKTQISLIQVIWDESATNLQKNIGGFIAYKRNSHSSNM